MTSIFLVTVVLYMYIIIVSNNYNYVIGPFSHSIH